MLQSDQADLEEEKGECPLQRNLVSDFRKMELWVKLS